MTEPSGPTLAELRKLADELLAGWNPVSSEGCLADGVVLFLILTAGVIPDPIYERADPASGGSFDSTFGVMRQPVGG